jgi:hypothetical protein
MEIVEARQAVENAIANGRGGVYLKLTPEQQAKLKERQVAL